MNIAGIEQAEEKEGEDRPRFSLFTWLRNFIAVCCVICFAITTSIILLVVNCEPVFMRPVSYQQVLVSERVYDRLPTALAEQFSRDCRVGDGTMDCFTQSDWETLLIFLLPADELKSQTERALSQLSGHLNSSMVGSRVRVLVSLSEFKSRLTSPECFEMIQGILATKKVCTVEQMRSAGRDTSNLPVCQPPEEYREAYWREFRGRLEEVASKIPQELDLLRVATEDGWEDHVNDPPRENDVFESEVRPTYRRIRLGLWLTPFLACPWLLLVLAFGVRTQQEWLRWWGSAFLVAGIVGLIVGAVLTPMLGWSFSALVQEAFQRELGASMTEVVHDVFSKMAGSYVAWIAMESAILGGLGLTMVFASKWQASI